MSEIKTVASRTGWNHVRPMRPVSLSKEGLFGHPESHTGSTICPPADSGSDLVVLFS